MATYTNRSPWTVDADGVASESFPTKFRAANHAAALRSQGHVPRLRQAREGQWRVRVRILGHPPLTATFPRRADAEKWARLREGEITAGQHVDPRTSLRVTIQELLTEFAKRIPEALRQNDPTWFRTHAIARDPVAQFAIAKLRPRHLAEYRDRRLTAAAPATVIRELNLIHRVLELARVERGLALHENPAASKCVPRPALPESARRTRRLACSGLGDERSEEARLLVACRSPVLVSSLGEPFRRRNPLLLPFVRLALHTGARRAELLALRWADVFLDRGYLRLRAETTKTRRERIIPLALRAKRVLMCLPRNGERVFEGLSASALEQAFTRACRRAGLENFRLHDLRHELTSRLFERTNLREFEIAAITGHRDLRMLARYTHLRPDWLVNRFAESAVVTRSPTRGE